MIDLYILGKPVRFVPPEHQNPLRSDEAPASSGLS
jgi:hypothetical protein